MSRSAWVGVDLSQDAGLGRLSEETRGSDFGAVETVVAHKRHHNGDHNGRRCDVSCGQQRSRPRRNLTPGFPPTTDIDPHPGIDQRPPKPTVTWKIAALGRSTK